MDALSARLAITFAALSGAAGWSATGCSVLIEPGDNGERDGGSITDSGGSDRAKGDPCSEVADSLVAYYPLDGVNVLVVEDKSPNELHASCAMPLSCPTTLETGFTDQALRFSADAIDELKVAGNGAEALRTTEGFTVATYVAYGGRDLEEEIIAAKAFGTGEVSWALGIDAIGRPMARVNQFSNDVAVPSAALDSGVWSHLAITWDGGILRLFVDGTVTSQVLVSDIIFDNGDLTIGGAYDPVMTTESQLHGVLDEFRIYSRALTAVEVDEMAACGHGVLGDPVMP